MLCDIDTECDRLQFLQSSIDRKKKEKINLFSFAFYIDYIYIYAYKGLIKIADIKKRKDYTLE